MILLKNTCVVDILDSALLRPGRIDRKIEFPPPGPEARVAILRIHSRKVRIAYLTAASQLNRALPLRCLSSVGSTFARSRKKWANVLVRRSAEFAQKLACTPFVSGDNMSRRKTSSSQWQRYDIP